MPRYAIGGTLSLRTVEEFLNTLDERCFSLHGMQHTGGDELATPMDLAVWLAAHGLVPAGTPARSDDLAMARLLRDALRTLLSLRAGRAAADQGAATGRATDTAEDSLLRANDALREYPLRVQATANGTPALLPADEGVPGALAAISAAVARAEAAGIWKRLKMCAAPDCRWVFYDTSRSGAGRWCSMQVCGNRDKTRTYRQRHRDQRKIP
jgi:predicted RNA-binding Zn ribbon-like protein